MSNFQIHFTYPWLLLLLVPALFFTLLPYFRIQKKYRRNRNRVVSVVVHSIAMVLSVLAFSGLNFTYDEPNPENELLLVVDMSYSGEKAQNKKDDFIEAVLEDSDGAVKVGVVTFGYDQVYAAPLSYDTKEVYKQYLDAKLPDETATDIASALTYAKDLFSYPETAKIILMTDGVETDGEALSVIKQIAAEGVQVDVMHFSADKKGNETQLVEVVMPQSRVEVAKDFEIGVTVESSFAGNATITLFDNDVKGERIDVDLKEGKDTFSLKHTFDEKGLHALRFEISSSSDVLSENNVYYSYIHLEDYNKILILERTEEESTAFQKALKSKALAEGQAAYDITSIVISDLTNVPSTIRQLRAYDQVVLFNISNADLPQFSDGSRFDEILQEYVRDYGGGLLTVGGNKEETDEDGKPIANTYVRDDMYGSIYQDMLPVEAINYTPPAGVMIVIDWSGSMSAIDPATGKSYLQLAKEGARSAIEALTERDYCGIVSLEDSYKEDLKPIPLPKKAELFATIENLGSETGGGTVYRGAIEQAGSALKKLSVVERKHIILVTDGAPSDSLEEYGQAIESNLKNDITMSIVLVGTTATNRDMESAAAKGNGRCIYGSMSSISDLMREELKLPDIKEVNYEDFSPKIDDTTAVLKGITQDSLNSVMLGGFYGTKLKDGAVQPLRSEYVPVYAQWEYGKGRVGSFMCELTGKSGSWSENFVGSTVGQLFLNNVVGDLFPLSNIKAQDVEVVMKEDNYRTELNIYPEKETKKDTYEITITSPTKGDGVGENKQTFETGGENESYKKVNFPITQAGVHEILVRQLSETGEESGKCVLYKAFSYSKEYDMFFDAEACQAMLVELAKGGRGFMIKSAAEAYVGIEKVHTETYSPTLPLIIAVLVLFLLDVAVRKFKFKWLHEIIRERKTKQEFNKK